jgi:hypothetical protein
MQLQVWTAAFTARSIERIAPMRRLLLGVCVFAVGCGGEMTGSPTSPSSTLDRAAPTQAAPAESAAPIQSAHAHQLSGLPFRGSYQQTETGEPQSPTTLIVTGTAVGTATNLGRYTMSFTALVDLTAGTGVGDNIFVAANGDRLFCTSSGQVTPTAEPGVLSIADSFSITGGTGRFEGATGNFSGIRLLNAATGISSGSFDGTINLVH